MSPLDIDDSAPLAPLEVHGSGGVDSRRVLTTASGHSVVSWYVLVTDEGSSRS